MMTLESQLKSCKVALLLVAHLIENLKLELISMSPSLRYLTLLAERDLASYSYASDGTLNKVKDLSPTVSQVSV